MNDVKIGCQTFTWEMLGDAWSADPDTLLEAIAAGGYAGIEITDTMIGRYAGDPTAFGAALDRAGLALVAYTVSSPSGFTEPGSIADDVEMVRRAARFVRHFPCAMLVMGSATVMSPGARDAKFDTAADVYGRACDAAEGEGVELAVHPSSHHDTLLFDEADYAAIFERMDARIGWVPDTGHILRGGMPLVDSMARWGDRLRYVHLKDVDATGRWTMFGEGEVDATAVAQVAAAAPQFTGWLVLEEESDEAGRDPAAAVKRNRDVLDSTLAGR